MGTDVRLWSCPGNAVECNLSRAGYVTNGKLSPRLRTQFFGGEKQTLRLFLQYSCEPRRLVRWGVGHVPAVAVRIDDSIFGRMPLQYEQIEA